MEDHPVLSTLRKRGVFLTITRNGLGNKLSIGLILTDPKWDDVLPRSG